MSRQHSKRRTKVSPMDDTHSQDWSTLDLGFPTVSCRTERLVDFDVYVHGLREIQDSTLPIAIVVSTVSVLALSLSTCAWVNVSGHPSCLSFIANRSAHRARIREHGQGDDANG